MVAENNATTLSATIERDLTTFKSQRERLYQLQTHPETIERSDSNMITTSSRSILKTYARELEALESKGSHTIEDKQAMHDLNTLLVMGDQLAEIRTIFAQAYEAKFGTIDNTTHELEQKSAGLEDQMADIDLDPSEASKTSTGTNTTAGNDPKGVYALLNLSPPVFFQVVQKAIKKKRMALHPDKNRDDPTAADRFAQFMALVEETMGTAEKKEKYDGAGIGAA
ncbi:hypothetical protein EJ03DRAFT_352048 [Teratosphaeria nubilosa]|uniref:J domain-containing protein n=1 Tax=Teratosphaeria nubilosa TaxID=161662 RepID=A0A6G1L6P2_9PEZI|nr:hypothetical protein EJ03DRAFT_352048 [Teratosphaeria nubilosa]